MTGCSVIVPTYNSGKTIKRCLEAVLCSDFKEFEVIVVDDASTDNTVEIAGAFPVKVVRLEKHSGASHARNTGQKQAKHGVLVFVDSDIMINKDTLSRIINTFEAQPEVAAIVGILSKSHPNKDFFSRYKNLYMNYVFNRCARYIDFIYGSCYGIRKERSEPYDVTYSAGEDTELGMRLSNKGYRILLDKNIQVMHLKGYSFLSFVRNDFRIPYSWARLFIAQKKWKGLFRERKVFHASGMQLLGIALFFLFLLSIFIHPFLALLFLLCTLALNIRFFSYFHKEYGPLFVLGAILVTWMDMLVMGAGIIAGFISYFTKMSARGLRRKI